MTRYRKLLATLVSATIVVGLLAGGGWLLLGSTAEAQGFGLALAAHRAGWQGRGHHGGHHDGTHCQRLAPEHVEIAGLMAKAHLDLDTRQYDALAPVLEVMEQWRQQVQTICGRELQSTDDALASLREVLAVSAAAVGRLQPAMRSFEATLNEDQRAHLQAWIDRHNRRTGGGAKDA